MRRLNLYFLAGLLTIAAALAGGFWLAHGFQISAHSSALLDRARRAEASHDLDSAVQLLGQYLNLKPDDGRAWAWYARVVDQKGTNSLPGEHRYLVFAEAMRRNPGDRELERRCALLALESHRYGDARHHIRAIYDPIEHDRALAAEAAELELLLGNCDVAERQFDQAAHWYRRAIAHDRARVDASNQLARLLRRARKDPGLADAEIEAAVRANSSSAAAYIMRWRYRRDFGPAADKNDVAKALVLGPDDADVLTAATELAQENHDLEGARRLLKRGIERHPANPIFPTMAALVERKDNHPERAEATLRAALNVVPQKAGLEMALVETLISEGKLDGPGGATARLDRLRAQKLADGYVHHLQARISMRREQWAEAVSHLDAARTLLASDAETSAWSNLLLSECHRRLGAKEPEIAALERAASGQATATAARVSLARIMEEENRLDQALRLHRELADVRPESRLDLVRLMIRTTLRLPSEGRSWEGVEKTLAQAEHALPHQGEALILLRTELLLAEGKPGPAESVLRRAIGREPQRTSYQISLARLLLRQGNDPTAAAVAALEVIRQAERGLGASPDLTLAKVEALARAGGDEARAEIKKLADDPPVNPGPGQAALLQRLTHALLELGDRDRALRLIGRLSSLVPDDPGVQMTVQELSIAAGDLPGAAAAVDRIRRIEGEAGVSWRYADALYQIELSRAGDTNALEHARAQTLAIEQERPAWWQAAALHGQIAELQNRLDEAALHYTRALDLGSRQPLAARRLIGLLFRMQQIDRIEQVIQKLEERGDDVGDLAVVRAFAAIRRHEPEKGLALARRMIHESATNSSDLLLLGRMLTLAGKLGEAERPLMRALDLAPGNPDAWLSYIRLLAQTNRKEQAAKLVDPASKAVPREMVPLVRAQAYQVVGDQAAASASYETALKLRPDDPGVLCPAADYFARRHQNDKAIPLLERLLSLDSDASKAYAAWARRCLATCLMSTGDPADHRQAVTLIGINRQEDPSSVEDLRAAAVLSSTDPGKCEESIQLFLDLERRAGLESKEEILLIERLERAGQWDQAEPRIQKLVASPTAGSDILAAYIDRLLRRRRAVDASPWLKILAQREPSAWRTRILTARLAQAQGKQAEAVAILRHLAAQAKDEIAKLAVAAELEANGALGEAEEVYRRTAAESRSSGAVLPLAAFLARTKRCTEAVALCEPLWPTSQAALAAGVCVTALTAGKARPEQFRDVEHQFQRALTRDPDDVQIVSELARLRQIQERWDEAETLLRQVVARDPRHVGALNDLAWVLARHRGKPTAALNLVEQAISLAGPDSTLLDTRAIAYIALERTDAAIADLKRAEAMSERPTVLFHLAQAYEKTRRARDSRESFERAKSLGLDPGQLDAAERFVYDKLEREGPSY